MLVLAHKESKTLRFDWCRRAISVSSAKTEAQNRVVEGCPIGTGFPIQPSKTLMHFEDLKMKAIAVIKLFQCFPKQRIGRAARGESRGAQRHPSSSQLRPHPATVPGHVGTQLPPPTFSVEIHVFPQTLFFTHPVCSFTLHAWVGFIINRKNQQCLLALTDTSVFLSSPDCSEPFVCCLCIFY